MEVRRDPTASSGPAAILIRYWMYRFPTNLPSTTLPMRHITKRVATLAIMLAVVTSLFAMPAAATFTEQPTVASSSDIADGATISVADASSNNSSALVVNTNNSDTMESADVTIDLADPDRDYTVYSSDMSADEYTMTADVDTDGDGTADSDEHTWNISHDEFADVPVAYNGSTDLNFEVAFTDGAGDTANVTGTITISNDGERVVTVVDNASIDNSGVGPSVESQTQEAGILATVSPLHDEPEHDTYTLDQSFDTSSNATHEIYFADSDVASAYDASAENADSGDVLVEQTMLADDGLVLTFADSANTDLVDTSSDSYAVYDSSADKLTLEPGDNVSSTIDVYSANQNPVDVESVSNADIASTFSDAFGTLDLIQNFSVGVGMAAFGIPTLGSVTAALVVVGSRRRYGGVREAAAALRS